MKKLLTLIASLVLMTAAGFAQPWQNLQTAAGGSLVNRPVNFSSSTGIHGSLFLYGSLSGSVGFTPAATAGAVNYTLPAADGQNNYVWTTDGNGNISWSQKAGVAAGTIASINGDSSAAQTVTVALPLSIVNTGPTHTLGWAGSKSDVGLPLVENTALSTWTGTTNLTTLGTIVTGVWHGSSVADAYVASAATWNAKVPSTRTINGYDLSTNRNLTFTDVGADPAGAAAAVTAATIGLGPSSTPQFAKLGVGQANDGGYASEVNYSLGVFGPALHPPFIDANYNNTIRLSMGFLFDNTVAGIGTVSNHDLNFYTNNTGPRMKLLAGGGFLVSTPLTADSGTGAMPATWTSLVGAYSTPLRSVAADGTAGGTVWTSFGGNVNNLSGLTYGGTRASPTATPDQSNMIRMVAINYDGTVLSGNGVYAIIANGLVSPTQRGTYHQWQGTLSGGTSPAEWMRLTDAKLGIGTSTPAYKLDVNGDVNIAAASHFKINGTNLAYGDVGADASGAAAAVTTTSIGAVPTSRTVNSKALSGNITLSAADVGADASGAAAAAQAASLPLSTWTNVKNAAYAGGAYGDGSHDDSGAIAAAIAALPATYGVLFFPPGRYKWFSASSLTISGKSNLTILGYGAELYDNNNAAGRVFMLVDYTCSYVTMEGLSINGNAVARVGGAHQLQWNASHSVVTDCYFQNGSQFSFYIGADQTNLTSDVTVNNCQIYNTWADGFHVFHVKNVTINNPIITYTADDAIGIIADQVGVNPSFVTINNPMIDHAGGNHSTTTGNGINIQEASDITVNGGSINVTELAPVYIRRFLSTGSGDINARIKIHGMTIQGGGVSAGVYAQIDAGIMNDCDISDNVLKSIPSGVNGISVYNFNRLNITGNKVYGGSSSLLINQNSSSYSDSHATFATTWDQLTVKDNVFNSAVSSTAYINPLSVSGTQRLITGLNFSHNTEIGGPNDFFAAFAYSTGVVADNWSTPSHYMLLNTGCTIVQPGDVVESTGLSVTQGGSPGANVIFTAANCPSVVLPIGVWQVNGSVTARTSDSIDTIWAQFYDGSSAFGGGACKQEATVGERFELPVSGRIAVTSGTKTINFKVFRAASTSLDVGSPAGPSGYLAAVRIQ
jgi:hypothetical protein